MWNLVSQGLGSGYAGKMCGRYSMTQSGDKIASQLRVRPIAFAPRYNLAPTQNAPVVLAETEVEMKLLRWGLIPSWARDASMGARLINARAETLLEKPAFKKPFEGQRCLVLADGYYEWKQKAPYRFTLEGEAPFAFAGLWDKWRQPDGTILQSFTIITSAANELARQVHGRMPVILPPEVYEPWLDPKCKDVQGLRSWLRPYSAARMTYYAVNSLVNSSRNDDPRYVMPPG